MLITHRNWNLIRHHFTEDEERQIKEATAHDIVRTSGMAIDIDLLPLYIKQKLVAEMVSKVYNK